MSCDDVTIVNMILYLQTKQGEDVSVRQSS